MVVRISVVGDAPVSGFIPTGIVTPASSHDDTVASHGPERATAVFDAFA